MAKKKTHEFFICELLNVTKGEFDISKVLYVNSKTKVILGCKTHGDFHVTPNHVLRGSGCPDCAGNKLFTNDEIIAALKTTFKSCDYSFELLCYKGTDSKVKIICNVEGHGVFEQTPYQLKKGRGCPKCSGAYRYSKENINRFFELAHQKTYCYSKVNFKKLTEKVKIICKVEGHGVFEQTPELHKSRAGCPKCGLIRSAVKRRERYRLGKQKITKKYLVNAYKIKKLSSVEISYITGHSASAILKMLKGFNIAIRSGAHAISKSKFKFSNYNLWSKHVVDAKPAVFIAEETKSSVSGVCNKLHKLGIKRPASNSVSVVEQQLRDFCRGTVTTLQKETRDLIKSEKGTKCGIDVYMPDERVAVELNGAYWHDEIRLPNPSTSHAYKTKECAKIGITLIHIWDTEWYNQRPIVESMLRAKLGKTPVRLGASKCKLRIVSASDARVFLDDNHLQGRANSTKRYGLYRSDELLALMTFKLNHKTGIWSLSRFCNKLNTSIFAGAKRLLTAFEREHVGVKLVTYANRRFSTGDLYQKLGFEQVSITPPTPWWVVNGRLYHHTHFRKYKQHKLLENFDPGQTEVQNMHSHGHYRVYDCGHIKFYKVVE